MKKSAYGNHGARVVAGQRLMQASSDIFLGWQRAQGIDGVPRDYYLRQLQDWKGSVDPETAIPEGMKAYAELCGHSLARAHARSGDRIAMAAYLGSKPAFEKALVRFAEAYADQNERDYEAVRPGVPERAAARRGRPLRPGSGSVVGTGRVWHRPPPGIAFLAGRVRWFRCTMGIERQIGACPERHPRP